jgi:hypothetical protein
MSWWRLSAVVTHELVEGLHDVVSDEHACGSGVGLGCGVVCGFFGGCL